MSAELGAARLFGAWIEEVGVSRGGFGLTTRHSRGLVRTHPARAGPLCETGGVGLRVSDSVVFPRSSADRLTDRSSTWKRTYVRRVRVADFGAAVVAVVIAAGLRFGSGVTGEYLVLTVVLPPLWIIAVRVVGGYEMRFLGTGSDEFRRVLNAWVTFTAALVLISYLVNHELSRAYLAITMSVMVTLDMLARFGLRKRLHRVRAHGQCMSTVVAVGHEPAVEQLIRELRREPYHGLEVVAACLAEKSAASEVAGVPVVGGIEATADVVRNVEAGTVAVLSCPEMDGIKLRTLAWELEKTRTDLYVAPALLDVAGPRTTIRPIAGLTLLHVDHPQLSGLRQVLKGIFDRVCGRRWLVLLSPLFSALAVAIRLSDNGPGTIHAAAGWQGGRIVQDLQVPHDGRGRGAAPGRTAGE